MAIARYRYNEKRKRRKGKFQRGFYQPMNESKYRRPQDTHMNAQQWPEYRSSWEKNFMMYLDTSEHISWWSSEPFKIMYISPKDGQPHRYFVDFAFNTIDNNKYLIEIKPKAQCKNPVNLAKWEAAERYCKQIGATFLVVTEVELKKWGLLKK